MEGLAGAASDLAALSARFLLHLGAERGNLAISPLSFHSILVLLAAGSTGETHDQIVSFLGPSGGTAHAALASEVASRVFAGGNGTGETEVRSAVGVWVDKSLRLRPAFADLVSSKFKAEARAMSFEDKSEEARVEINRWFEDKTGGLIRELMPEGHICEDTVVVLGNALYLKATWLDPFDPDSTVDGDFHLSGGSQARVPFMRSTDSQRIGCHPGFKVVQLPYEPCPGRRFCMYIYLPDERDGLQALVRELSSGDPAAFLDRCVPEGPVAVGDFRIPRFKASFKVEASSLLRDLGLERPFRRNNDFSEMVDGAAMLAVSAVHHECVVEVNEKGTMAGAATAAVIKRGSALYREELARVDFVADHPFMFVIREENTGIVCFAGQVVNPLL